MSTRPSPMAPAMRPAESWSAARVGPSSVTTGTVNRSGSAPYLRLFARVCADFWEKLPLISAWPFGITPLTVGAEMTLPSRTIANCFCCPVSGLVWLAICRVTSAKVLRAVLSKVRLTTHCTWFCGMPASAFLSWVPSISAEDSSSLLPSLSQVTSGWFLLSTTGAAACLPVGQVNAANFFSHLVPGLSIHLSGWSTGAPAGFACGVADGAAVGAALDDADALADGDFDGFALSACTPPRTAGARPLGVAVGDGFGPAEGAFDGDGLAEPEGDAEPLADGLGEPEGCG